MSKIGVGILTYNRKNHFYDLVRSLPLNRIDEVIAIKDFGGKQYFIDTIPMIELQSNHGIGKCKHKAINYLREKGCKHIFLIEDDIIIKSSDVFDRYIEVSKKLNLPHLMYSQADSYNPKKLTTEDICLYEECRGSFTYFTREALTIDIDLKYYNALEHVDHYYAMQVAGLVPPLYWFPDIVDSDKYVGNNPLGTSTTIKNNLKYNENLQKSFQHWVDKWNFTFKDYIMKDKNDINSVVQFLKRRIDIKKKY